MPVAKASKQVHKFHQGHKTEAKEILRRRAQYNLVLSYMASAHRTKPEFLLTHNRGSKHLSDARHIANYLAHVVFGINFTDISKMAARDRTSIAHGCHRVEDLRDLPHYDRPLHFAELALQEFFDASWECANDDKK
ncbi:MAG: Chromosomal replication initiator protein DnaA [Alphaproteobacteria bacterium]|nr:MAG: Chromosomal replication initiator protein DnaA [Alphaproteobacteria bacterium]